MNVVVESEPKENDETDNRGHAKVEVASDQQSLAI